MGIVDFMKICCECGKQLHFWQTYYHPILGKKNYVCCNCFTKLDDSMKKYREFILREFYTKKPTRMSESFWKQHFG